MKRIILTIAALMLLAQPAFAGGFMIGEQGARAEGMGGAFTGVADDPSALWFNPAGIAFQKGIIGTAGLDVIMPNNKYTDPTTGLSYTAAKKTFVTPQGYLVYNTGALPVAFGLGINTPFGLSTDWRNTGAPFTAVNPANPAFAILAPATVTFSKIEMLNINPSVAYKINDHLSIAAGVSYYNVNKVELDNQVLALSGNGDGWGGNVAIMYKNGPLGFGVSYRSRVKAKISGSAAYPIGAAVPALPPGFSTAANTSITFPDMVNVGVSYRVSEALLVSADVDWVNWKTFDKLVVNQPAFGAAGTLTIPENWKATTSFRLGAEWGFAPKMRARLGYVYDPTPLNNVDFSPRLPGNNRQLFNLGFGYDFGAKTTLDLAYSYVLLNDRNQTASAAPFYNGTYKSDTHIVAASITHQF